jgi:hypothetical protein
VICICICILHYFRRSLTETLLHSLHRCHKHGTLFYRNFIASCLIHVLWWLASAAHLLSLPYVLLWYQQSRSLLRNWSWGKGVQDLKQLGLVRLIFISGWVWYSVLQWILTDDKTWKYTHYNKFFLHYQSWFWNAWTLSSTTDICTRIGQACHFTWKPKLNT